MKPAFVVRLATFVSSLGLLPAVLSAHPGHDGGHGLEWDFAGGFTHPIFGLDHLFAMVAVGVWAAQLGGRARWIAPATFVGVMALGAFLGAQQVAVPAVEQMIAASLLVLGLMIVLAKRLPFALGLGLVALFAAFHGFAHGAELPASSDGLSYGLGFVASTLLLHGCGLAVGKAAVLKSVWIPRVAGVALASFGAVMLAN